MEPPSRNNNASNSDTSVLEPVQRAATASRPNAPARVRTQTDTPAAMVGRWARRRERRARRRAIAAVAGATGLPLALPGKKGQRRTGTLFFGVTVCLALFALMAVLSLIETPQPAIAQQQPGVAASAPAASPEPSAAATPLASEEKASLEGAESSETETPATPEATAALTPPNWGRVGIYLGLVALFTLFHAAFSMAETALVSLRRSRVEQLVEEGQKGAATIKRLGDDPSRFIATVRVGMTLLGFAAAAAAATTLAAPLGYGLTQVGLAVGIAQTLSVVLTTLLIAVLSMVLGEIAPKSLAIQAPDRWAMRLAPFVNLCAIVFAPITSLVVGLSNILVRPFGARAQFEMPIVTKEELEHIIGEGAESGELDREEQTILENVFDFSETLVRSVMTPRIDMTALAVTASLDETLDLILSSGHSRIPVYEETIDNIIGIVHAKDLLRVLRGATSETIGEVELRRVMRAAHFVPETKRVADLLAEMRRSNQQLAIVQDEYAGTEGLVTIEDLLEEIVGDIRDEYDVDEPEVNVVSATETLIDGRMSIDDVNDRLGIELPHEEYETIGGLIFGLLGHEPMAGERVRFDGHEFIVEHVEGRRIRTIRAVRIGEGGATVSEESEAEALQNETREGEGVQAAR